MKKLNSPRGLKTFDGIKLLPGMVAKGRGYEDWKKQGGSLKITTKQRKKLNKLFPYTENTAGKKAGIDPSAIALLTPLILLFLFMGYIAFFAPKPDAVKDALDKAGTQHAEMQEQVTGTASALSGILLPPIATTRSAPTPTGLSLEDALATRMDSRFLTIEPSVTATTFKQDFEALTQAALVTQSNLPACTPPPGIDPCYPAWVAAGKGDVYWLLWTPAPAPSPTRVWYATLSPAEQRSLVATREARGSGSVLADATSEPTEELGASER